MIGTTQDFTLVTLMQAVYYTLLLVAALYQVHKILSKHFERVVSVQSSTLTELLQRVVNTDDEHAAHRRRLDAAERMLTEMTKRFDRFDDKADKILIILAERQ